MSSNARSSSVISHFVSQSGRDGNRGASPWSRYVALTQVMDRSQGGFTLIEVLIAGAIAAFVLFTGITIVAQNGHAAQSLNARLTAQGAADRLAERLTSDAASAWAVYVAPFDVFGRTNADGHEIEFFTEDGSHRPYAWCYFYDANAKSVTRYTYMPGGSPMAGEMFASFDDVTATFADVTDLTTSS